MQQYDHLESLSNIFTEVHRKPSTTIDMNPNTAAGIHNMSKILLDLVLFSHVLF